MVGKKREREAPKKSAEPKQNSKRQKDETESIHRCIGVIDPRLPHPRDIDQPRDHDFDYEDLGEELEGEIFDNYDLSQLPRNRSRTKGGSNCNSVLVQKHLKPLPMWFDEFLCPRVMPGKWCGYVGYAFRRRIRLGSWPTWREVPQHVLDDAWSDVLESWDFRTALNEVEHAKLKKQWTTYAAQKQRCWRSTVWSRYVAKRDKQSTDPGHPCDKYKWLDPKEWDLFVANRSTDDFKKLSAKNSANALKKKYKHRTGSGGYRRIYIRKAKAMRRKEIERLMNEEGMTREEAELKVRDMVFRVDRSIVFLEANIDPKTKLYAQEFVRDLAGKILEMNRDKEEGKLIIEGRRDILALALDEDDKPGKYRACPTTAGIDFALPDWVKLRNRQRQQARKNKMKAEAAQDEEELIEARLEDFSSWIAGRLGVVLSEDVSPKAFLEEQRRIHSNKVDSSNTSKPEAQQETGDTTPSQAYSECFLSVRTPAGIIETVAAGLLHDGPEPHEGVKIVMIRPPILLPLAELPIPIAKHDTVATAVGVTLLWPADLIHNKIQQDIQASPERTVSESSMDDDDDDAKILNVENPESEDDYSDLGLGSSPPEIDLVVDLKLGSMPPPREVRVVSETMVPDYQKTWNFEHHQRDGEIRQEVSKFLKELNDAPNRIDDFTIPLKRRVFGKTVANLRFNLSEAQRWMKIIDKSRKEWITAWQMDMWASLLVDKLQSDKQCSRVQVISVATSFCGHTTEAESYNLVPTNVVNLMKEKQARLYVMPICTQVHWMMFIIVPEQRVIYCIDPEAIGVSETRRTFLHKLMLCIGDKYDLEFASEEASSSDLTKWRTSNIIHKKQPGRWECGYYCMLYMEKIVLLYSGVDVHEVFPEDFAPYDRSIIEGMIDTFCFHIMDTIAIDCRAMIRRRRRNRPTPVPKGAPITEL